MTKHEGVRNVRWGLPVRCLVQTGWRVIIWVAAGVVFLAPRLALGQVPAPPSVALPPELEDIRIDQRLGAQVSSELVFRSSQGDEVRLGDLLGERPLVLSLVYYRCESLCSASLNGVLRALNALTLGGEDRFDVLTVSIDPKDTPQIAAKKRDAYLQRYRNVGDNVRWHFWVGSEDNVAALAEAVGFRYVYHEASQQFAHAAGLIVLTPEGVVSRYLLGLEVSARDLRLALVEASRGQVGNVVDQVLLYCFRYDPSLGAYSLVVLNVLRGAAGLTLLAIVGWLARSLWRERKGRARVVGGGHAR